MKTEKELNNDILNISMLIREKFPELDKYIIEMPTKVFDLSCMHITTKNLTDYYNSLTTLFKRYSVNSNK